MIKNEVFRVLPIEFRLKDVLQVLIGASILAVPVGFTEETWSLGEALPSLNIFLLFLVSLIFISAFVYYHYHKGKHNHSKKVHWGELTKRVLSTYVLSFLVVAVLLTIIQRTPWMTDWVLALKRTVIVAFPSSMSATVADIIR